MLIKPTRFTYQGAEEKENLWYWPLDVLCENILARQENLVSREITRLLDLFLNSRYGDEQSQHDFEAIKEIFSDFACRLEHVFHTDRTQVFSYARKLVECHYQNGAVQVPPFSSLSCICENNRQVFTGLVACLGGIVHLLKNLSPPEETRVNHDTLVLELLDLELCLKDLLVMKFDICFPRLLELEYTVRRSTDNLNLSYEN